ncbi:MAG: UPF0280 family protein, partial [Kiloniellales bacterium]|nr:UPF0280 family protein [Kiloniellales bacterium]
MTGVGIPPCMAVLPDGRRRHLQHGPIDIVLEAFGPAAEQARAYDQAWRRFRSILEELTAELPLLRRAVGATTPEGAVARRMQQVCRPHGAVFVTPMAAVAGAVADAVLAAMVAGRRLDRAYVNNGGDIALHLAPGQGFTTGIVTLGAAPALDGLSRVAAESPVRGIATSGWRGRSFSLGIADSVTVLAGSAAAADVAATLVANAVDVADPAIRRRPARELAPDCDLDERPVTVEVGPLPPDQVESALAAGAAAARDMAARGLIVQALLSLQGRSRVVG